MKHIDLKQLLKGKTPINVAIDREARAVYFKVTDEEVFRTERPNNSLSIDYNSDDEVVGVEIIRVNTIEVLLRKALKDIYSNIPAKQLAI